MKKYTLTLMLAFLFCNLSGQRIDMPTLSPFSEIKQQVGLTEITVQYSRPSAKGRTIMGELVPYQKMWRTGANASTKIILNESATIGGNKIEAGTYAIYTIPDRETWTIIIHSNTRHRSIAGDVYNEREDVCRFKVPVISNPLKEETFTIQFTDLTTNACNIRLSWENTVVNIPVMVEVDSKILAQIDTLVSDMDFASHRALFQAAEYFLHNKKNLDKALSWINSALQKSENNFRYGLLKAKILNAKGSKKEAIEAIDMAHQWAVLAGNANYMEQTALYKKELLKDQ